MTTTIIIIRTERLHRCHLHPWPDLGSGSVDAKSQFRGCLWLPITSQVTRRGRSQLNDFLKCIRRKQPSFPEFEGGTRWNLRGPAYRKNASSPASSSFFVWYDRKHAIPPRYAVLPQSSDPGLHSHLNCPRLTALCKPAAFPFCILLHESVTCSNSLQMTTFVQPIWTAALAWQRRQRFIWGSRGGGWLTAQLNIIRLN